MSHYQPPAQLLSFLKRGAPPVYIGFGSIVLQNPNEMLGMILDAVKTAGARAIISKGWSNLAVEDRDDVYLIGDCPHEWLFTKVAAVVHHGGAGTTACGLKNGKPTFIIPFFGEYVMKTPRLFFSNMDTNAATTIANSSGDKWSQPQVLGPYQYHTNY
jgi:UDP:flavonoid glycosyltransferase YjiC (YdhE family)